MGWGLRNNAWEMKGDRIGLWYFGKMRGWNRQTHAVTVLERSEGYVVGTQMSKTSLIKEGYVSEGGRQTLYPQ
jgi:hypothetical protein